jgi:hypothetical protein
MTRRDREMERGGRDKQRKKIRGGKQRQRLRRG